MYDIDQEGSPGTLLTKDEVDQSAVIVHNLEDRQASSDFSWQDIVFHSDPIKTTERSEFKSSSERALTIRDTLSDPVRGSLDDSLVIEHYQSSPLWLCQGQRKGLSQFIPSDLPPIAHVGAAMFLRFPLSSEMPLPLDLRRAIDFSAGSSKDELVSFWASQIAKLREVASSLSDQRKAWASLAPPEIAQVSSNLHIPLLKHCLKAFGMEGDRWVNGFIFGFPMTGTHSQENVYPIDRGVAPAADINIWDDSVERFLTRSKAASSSHDACLWEEALSQVNSGWLEGPWELVHVGSPIIPSIPQPININHAFRFGVAQGEKVRACDDLKANRVNSITSILSPITLPSWGHIASSVLRFQFLTRMLHFP